MESENPEIWKDPNAKSLFQKIKNIENKIKDFEIIESNIEYIKELLSIAVSENNEEYFEQLADESNKLLIISNKSRLENLMSETADPNNVFLEIHAGAGGTESQDWAEMLLRMYIRWSEKQNAKILLLQETRGEEAGIKSSTVKIEKNYAYGWLKRESGIHRLVRISPFDSNKRRHTSFASVWVYPEIDDKIEVSINESDLRIDTYRASGAGGQHVNKTDSAVRLTHVPTGIVVECQDSRSQHKNKARAETLLKAKIFDQQQEKLTKQRAEERKILIGSGDRSERIRTYNFPQGRVTDHRIGLTLYNLSEIMEGDINELIQTLIQENAAKQIAFQEN